MYTATENVRERSGGAFWCKETARLLGERVALMATKVRKGRRRLEGWTDRNTGRGRFVHPDLVFVGLHVQGDLSRLQGSVSGIVRGRHREVLIPAVALGCTGSLPACPADDV